MKGRSVRNNPIVTVDRERGVVIAGAFRVADMVNSVPVLAVAPAGEE
jgi:hypothetical protein